MSLSQIFFSLNHSFYTIVHILYEIYFTSAKSSHVRDIIDMIVSFSVFSMSSSDLDMIFVCNTFEFFFLVSEFW